MPERLKPTPRRTPSSTSTLAYMLPARPEGLDCEFTRLFVALAATLGGLVDAGGYRRTG